MMVVRRERLVYGSEDASYTVRILAPGGGEAALISAEMINIIELPNGESSRTIPLDLPEDSAPWLAAFNPGGDQLTLVEYQLFSRDVSVVEVWDVISSSRLRTFTIPSNRWNTIISAAGDLVAIVTGDLAEKVEVWDTAAAQKRFELPEGLQYQYSMAFSPDGNLLATQISDAIVIWETASGKQIHSMPNRMREEMLLFFSSDGKLIISLDKGYPMKIWGVP